MFNFFKIYKYILIISCFIFLNLISSKTISAEQKGLVISPAELVLNVNSGFNNTYTFNLINQDINIANVSLKVAEINNKQIILKDFSSKSSTNWIKVLTVNSFKLKQGDSKTITYSINIPENAPVGNYNPLILVELNNENINNLDNVSLVNFSVGYKLTLLVSNKQKNANELKINKFIVDKNVIFNDNATFVFQISNTDITSFSKPIGYFQIINPKGEIVEQKIINESLELLSLDTLLNQNINISFDKNNLTDFGKYRAELLFVDNLTNKSTIQKINFIIIPPVFIFFTFILIILIIVLLIRKKNSNNNLHN